MMYVVLEAAVNHLVVWRDEGMFVPTVEIHTVTVEKQAKLYKQNVHVNGKHKWQNKQRHRSHDLVSWLVSYHREWARIAKHMVMLVVLPKPVVNVSQAVVSELKQVTDDPAGQESCHMVGQRVTTPTTEGLPYATPGKF